MSGKELAALVNALAINIADCKSGDELAVLSGVFMLIGDTLSLIAAQNALLENYKNNDSVNNKKSSEGQVNPSDSYSGLSDLTSQQTTEIVNNVAKSVAGAKKQSGSQNSSHLQQEEPT